MKLLITGGDVFIVSDFIYYLLQNYYKNELICLDALTYADNLEPLQLVIQQDNFK